MNITPIVLSLLTLTPGAFAQQRTPVAPKSPEIVADGVTTAFYDASDLVLDRLPGGALSMDKKAHLAVTQELVDSLEHVMDGRKRGLISVTALDAGQIKIAGAPATHEYVQDFLDAQRSAPIAYPVSMLLFEMPAGHLKKLGLDASSAIFETPLEFDTFLNTARSDMDVSIISTPKIIVRPRSEATVSIINQISYIADYILQIVEPGNTEILDPIIGVVEDGVEIMMSATPVPGDVVQFDIEVRYSILKRPIKTIKTRIQSGDGPEVEISLPEVDSISLKSVIALTEGSAALISSASPSKDRDFAVLIQFPKTKGPANTRVSKLFDEMRSGTYEHRWFPPLTTDDIPALLAMSASSRELKNFPTNPLSSQLIETCPEGVIALWLIEGICEGGNLPSLNPVLLHEGSGLSLSDALSQEQQVKLLSKARIAYAGWWGGVSNTANITTSALANTGLRWF